MRLENGHAWGPYQVAGEVTAAGVLPGSNHDGTLAHGDADADGRAHPDGEPHPGGIRGVV